MTRKYAKVWLIAVGCGALVASVLASGGAANGSLAFGGGIALALVIMEEE